MPVEERKRRKREAARRWRRLHPEHRDRYRAWTKRYYQGANSRYAKYQRRDSLKRRYGITEGLYQEMFDAQHGVCAICKTPPTLKRRLAIDHCHKHGHIRALLCAACNVRLGVLENPAFCRRALAYLKTHSWRASK